MEIEDREKEVEEEVAERVVLGDVGQFVEEDVAELRLIFQAMAGEEDGGMEEAEREGAVGVGGDEEADVRVEVEGIAEGGISASRAEQEAAEEDVAEEQVESGGEDAGEVGDREEVRPVDWDFWRWYGGRFD